MIFLVLTESLIEQNLSLIEKAGKSIRGVELRADFLEEDPKQMRAALQRLTAYCRDHGLLSLFTLRRPADGGLFEGGDLEALARYREAADCGFDFADLDEFLTDETTESLLREKGTRLIRSFHDFNGIPKDLVERMRRASEAGVIPKAAVMISSTADLIRLLDCAGELAGVEKILIGMGSAGFPTRVLTRRFGSMLTFSSFNINKKELGHVDPLTLADRYRYYENSSTTALSGIIGNPVMHTRSPEIHNDGYKRCGLDALYLPFETDDPARFWELAGRLNIQGLSVTVPHKERVIELLDDCEEAVRAIGACNTVVFDHSGGGMRSTGMNTDVEGFVRPLLSLLSSEKDKRQKPLRAALIGAGGAARALLFGLRQMGAEVSLFNRTEETARKLASEFGDEQFQCDGYGLNQLAEFSGSFDLIVQSSSAGMGSLSGIDPSEGYRFSGKEIAFEIVYAPEWTRFLLRARDAGCRTIGGLAMLEAQAQRQFELFTGGYQLSGQKSAL